MLHNQESFLSKLSILFERGKRTGKSLRITIKQYDGRTKRNPRKPNDKPKKGAPKPACQGGDLPGEHKCLIRAKLGDDKISAAICQKDINKFLQSYSTIIKGNINLKKQNKPQGNK